MTVRFKPITYYNIALLNDEDAYHIQIDNTLVYISSILAVAGKELQLLNLEGTITVSVGNYLYPINECLIIDEDRFKFNLFKKEIKLRNNNV